MARTAVQVDKAEYEKDPENITKVATPVPGVGTVDTYWQTQYVDDLSGKPAEGTETYQFAAPVEYKDDDGETQYRPQRYEIDLSPANRDALIKALAKFTDKAREVTGGRIAASKAGPNPEMAAWNKRVRDWLNNSPETPVKKNEEVPDRGRIKAAWEDAYMAAHPDDPKPGTLGAN